MRSAAHSIEHHRPGVIAYAVLVALALFQLSFAVHQNEHAAGDVADTCSVCVQHDQFDDAPVALEPDAILHANRLSLVEDAQLALRITSITAYHGRAPPTI